MSNVQEDFDGLVRVAEAWFRCDGFTEEERALAEKIEAARSRDPGIADAAVAVAFSRVAPPDLQWR